MNCEKNVTMNAKHVNDHMTVYHVARECDDSKHTIKERGTSREVAQGKC